jgi:hypothetical protein
VKSAIAKNARMRGGEVAENSVPLFLLNVWVGVALGTVVVGDDMQRERMLVAG